MTNPTITTASTLLPPPRRRQHFCIENPGVVAILFYPASSRASEALPAAPVYRPVTLRFLLSLPSTACAPANLASAVDTGGSYSGVAGTCISSSSSSRTLSGVAARSFLSWRPSTLRCRSAASTAVRARTFALP